MNRYFLFILLVSVSTACSDKAATEKLTREQQAIASSRIVGIGKIIPEQDIIQLTSPVNGIVEKIYKQENDTVSIGSIILELNHDLEDEKMRQLTNEITTQAAQIQVDVAAVAEYAAKVNNAKLILQRSQNLLAKGGETQETVDNETTDLKTLQASVNRLDANVRVSQSRLQETRTALKTAQLERDQKIIRSPVRGRMLELTVLIGGAVSMQEAFAQIGPEGKTIAICEIDELNAEKIVVGQKGWIRNVGASDTLSTGTIYFASTFLKKKSLFTDQSGEKEDRRVRTLKMMLDHPEHLLLNARVECVIAISSTPNN